MPSAKLSFTHLANTLASLLLCALSKNNYQSFGNEEIKLPSCMSSSCAGQ